MAERKQTFEELERKIRRLEEESAKGKKAQEALKESEKRLKLAEEVASIGHFVWDIPSGNITPSPSLERIYGLEHGKFVGRYESWLLMVHEQDRERVLEFLKKGFARKKRKGAVEFRIVRPDGEIRWVEARGVAEYGSDGTPLSILGVHIDITKRKDVEEELRNSEQLYRSIFENSLDGIFLTRTDGQILAANPAACKMHDYTEAQIKKLGRQGVADQSDPRLARFLEERSRRRKHRAEMTHIRKDGTRFPCEVASAMFKDRQGRDSSVVIIRDITERKEAEEAIRRSRDELEERVRERTVELERSNRDLQDFAFVASHDLQEPLRKIQMFGEMLTTTYKKSLDEKGVDYLERMQDAARRMQTLISALLDYSRVTTKAGAFKPSDLNDVAREAISNVDFWIRKEKGEVQAETLPIVESDRLQMVRLFQNLLSNGLKYHKKDKPPSVSVYARQVAAKKGEASFQIFFEDDGIGFEEKFLDRIFKPFERLHGRTSSYSGVGMGLAICKKIVERHNGTITAKSTLGKGTTFIVTLPAKQTDQTSAHRP